jgi:hypothetical protein
MWRALFKNCDSNAWRVIKTAPGLPHPAAVTNAADMLTCAVQADLPPLASLSSHLSAACAMSSCRVQELLRGPTQPPRGCWPPPVSLRPLPLPLLPPQIPLGVAADRVGGARLLIACLFLWSLASLLFYRTPTMRNPLAYMLAARAALGLGQSCIMPAVSSLSARWLPPDQRSRCGGLLAGRPVVFRITYTWPARGPLFAGRARPLAGGLPPSASLC